MEGGSTVLGMMSTKNVFVAILILATTSCDSATYSVLESSQSPDKAQAALLVERRTHDALSSDEYYVILANGQPGTLDLAKVTHDRPVLVATRAQDLKINWSGMNSFR